MLSFLTADVASKLTGMVPMYVHCLWRGMSQWVMVATVCIVGVGQSSLLPSSFVHYRSFLYLLGVVSIIILPYCRGAGSPLTPSATSSVPSPGRYHCHVIIPYCGYC